jgi:hypothetical protein
MARLHSSSCRARGTRLRRSGHVFAVVPGGVSRTVGNHGVLFLDELPEFSRAACEALRQPLEEGEVTVSRAMTSVRFPAHFALVAAANPCPCGHLGDSRFACRCSPYVIFSLMEAQPVDQRRCVVAGVLQAEERGVQWLGESSCPLSNRYGRAAPCSRTAVA